MSSNESGGPRQRVVRVAGARRAQLTAVPGTDPDPEASAAATSVVPATDAPGPVTGTAAAAEAPGPNDERLRRDVPPHY